MIKMVRSRIYKIALLGEGGVGKTALRHRYLGQGFKDNYQMTIGADFAAKRVTVDGVDITAQIWDLAGQQRFNSVRSTYYKGCVGALLVFDITRLDTYNIIPSWLEELLTNNSDRVVPVVLIGNKGDLRGQAAEEIHPADAEAYAKALSDWSGYNVPYVETSAKSGNNVELAFQTLLTNINVYLESFRTQ